MKKEKNKNPIQPVSGTKVPRFAGPSTFARLPELRDVKTCDVAIVGIPFDAGTSYRPGARFGPQSIRQASRHLRTNYHPNYDSEPICRTTGRRCRRYRNSVIRLILMMGYKTNRSWRFKIY